MIFLQKNFASVNNFAFILTFSLKSSIINVLQNNGDFYEDFDRLRL